MSTTSKDVLEGFRKDEWPFRHDEFDEWPRHARPPMHLRSELLAFDPLSVGAAALSAIGTAVSASGTIAAGQNAQALGQFQQTEYAQQGETDVATAQRKMLEQQRTGRLVQSQLVARAAGGGSTPSTGSDVNLSSQIAGRSTYNSLMDLSAGQNVAAGLTNQGSAAAYQGNLSAALAPTAALGTIAGGAGSIFAGLSRNPAATSFVGRAFNPGGATIPGYG